MFSPLRKTYLESFILYELTTNITLVNNETKTSETKRRINSELLDMCILTGLSGK